jgi:hypothetical protein
MSFMHTRYPGPDIIRRLARRMNYIEKERRDGPPEIIREWTRASSRSPVSSKALKNGSEENAQRIPRVFFEGNYIVKLQHKGTKVIGELRETARGRREKWIRRSRNALSNVSIAKFIGEINSCEFHLIKSLSFGSYRWLNEFIKLISCFRGL